MVTSAGCGVSVDPEPGLVVGAGASALVGTNGLQVNGLQVNGLQVNGLQVNGLQVNGLQVNGLQVNGIGKNGLQVNGLQVNGLQVNGLYINRIGLNGVALDGTGASSVGTGGQGASGIVVSGIGLDAVGPDAIGTDGEAMDGRFFDDVSVNGFYLHGVGENGLVVGDTPLRARGLDGLRVNGADGIRRNAAFGAGPMDLEPEREAVLAVALHHLVGCALPAGDAATITAGDGAPVTYSGLRGLAPEWKTGALDRDSEGRVRACLESSPAASFGLALNQEQEANLKILLRYMIECALDADQEAIIYAGDGTPEVYAGSLGLAPEWQSGPLGHAGARKVSACVGARANGLGQTVSISLRHPEIATTPVEVDLFTTHEGAFWGDFFGPEPYIAACVVDGGGLSGRICAESESCGFVVQGDCADVCAAFDPIDGYSMCGPELATEVVNTFLNLGSRVTFGDGNVCVVGEDHGLRCWGENDHGQLADGTTAFRSSPVPVEELGLDVAEVAMGEQHACARTHGGELWCWGRNDRGQVGDGSTLDRHAPAHVAGDVATFAMGQQHTCAVKTDGSALCWGENQLGRLGAGSKAKQHSEPQPVAGMSSGVARLASSTTAAHTCAVKGDGSAWCWGRNQHGQLGDGSHVSRAVPVHVDQDDTGAAFGEVTDMCTAKRYTCARKADTSLWCWGAGVSERPTYLADAVAPGGLSCGEQHACFVDTDARVWCFGLNPHGQLGPGSDKGDVFTPQLVEGVEAASFVNAGRTHTCATRVDGRLLCWGTDPGTDQPLFPVPLSGTPVEIPLELE